jgi:ADP-heptose:LPS heptosyltransferase
MSPATARPVHLFSVTSIGDLVLATSVFDLARADGAALTVVTAPPAAALLRADPRLSAVRLVRSSSPVGWRIETLRALLAARRARATLVNLEVYPARWAFLRRAASALRLPARTLDLPALRADNARSSHGEPTSWPHRAHYYARALDCEGEPPPPRLLLDDEARAAVERRVRREVAHEGLPARVHEHVRVVVHPGSTEAARRPAPALLASAVGAVGTHRRILPILVGTPDELGDALRLEAALSADVPRLNLCGRLPLGELPALIASASLFVGGDSGPLKVAEAVGARTLSFWAPGATAPAFAGPRGPGHAALGFDADSAAVTRALSGVGPEASRAS